MASLSLYSLSKAKYHTVFISLPEGETVLIIHLVLPQADVVFFVAGYRVARVYMCSSPYSDLWSANQVIHQMIITIMVDLFLFCFEGPQYYFAVV